MRVWLKPRRAKKMTSQEAAWLAGFFDGEGSVVNYRKSGWRLQLPNTHKKSIDYIVKITGVPNVHIKKPTEGRKQQWIWHVERQRDMFFICKQMLPYLITKYDAVKVFLDQWKDL